MSMACKPLYRTRIEIAGYPPEESTLFIYAYVHFCENGTSRLIEKKACIAFINPRPNFGGPLWDDQKDISFVTGEPVGIFVPRINAALELFRRLHALGLVQKRMYTDPTLEDAPVWTTDYSGERVVE